MTMLLRDWRAGSEEALHELTPLVYGELHKLAVVYMRGERAGHTMRPTDLVGDAFLRLAQGQNPEWDDRVHFFGIAARIMRQILVDYARKRNAEKRGAGEHPVTLEDGLVGAEGPAELLALHDALQALAKFDERKARAVELRSFGGLNQQEIATVLGVHVNTVASDLRLADAWLRRELRQ